MKIRRVCIVGDSLFAETLGQMLAGAPAVEVVGAASTPEAALPVLEMQHPDAVIVAGVGKTLLLLAASLTAPQSLAAAPALQGPTTWTVILGGQAGVQQTSMGPMGAWQFMRFYPGTITVNVGDTIVWKLASADACCTTRWA
jgi:DNA-binding NarL/FixJ family response regulator